ncbi:hypothetical protein HK405_003579 [Cladochytrium tenue]|nr:hypothetical protein HK405_003579 [Cladochytrium tenue]
MKACWSTAHELHDPPVELGLGQFVPYKECPQRAKEVRQALAASGLLRADAAAPVDHGIEPIRRVHSDAYLKYFESAYATVGLAMACLALESHLRDFGFLWAGWIFVRKSATHTGQSDLDRSCADVTTVVTEGTYKAAYEAAQMALTAADILMADGENAVFALCHHSYADLMAGYCFLNNAAIAARYLIEEKSAGKVAIIDIDYHHGDGTQDIFYRDANPLYLSLHGTPDYPYYTGTTAETGEGPGAGGNRNVPLPLGTGDAEYLTALGDALETTVKEFAPDVLVVSLGVDTYVEDVLGGFLLTSDCFTEVGRMLGNLKVPTLFIMEGGYHIPAIGKNVTNVLRGNVAM